MTGTAPTFSISPIAVQGYGVAAEALNAGFAESDLVTCVAVSIAESGLNAAAISPPASDKSRGYGLMQIEFPTHADLFPGQTVNNLEWVVPMMNLKMAHEVYLSQGWHAWTTYFTGMYTGHIPEATMAVATLKQKALAAKKSLAEYAAAVSKDTTAAISPVLISGGLAKVLGDAAVASASSAGQAAGSFASLYQGYSGPQAGNPLLRLVEIGLGGVLLIVGLNKIASPVTAPIVGVAKSAAKIVP